MTTATRLDRLKSAFTGFNEARAYSKRHYGVTAKGWQSLAEKLSDAQVGALVAAVESDREMTEFRSEVSAALAEVAELRQDLESGAEVLESLAVQLAEDFEDFEHEPAYGLEVEVAARQIWTAALRRAVVSAPSAIADACRATFWAWRQGRAFWESGRFAEVFAG